MNRAEMAAKRAAAIETMRALHAKTREENRVLTEEEQKAFDGADAQFRDLQRMIDNDDKLAALEADQAKLVREPITSAEQRTASAAPSIEVGESRDRFHSLGEQVIACIAARQGQGMHPVQRAIHGRAIEKAAADARASRASGDIIGEVVPSDGGFLVQKDFTASLLKRAYDTGFILRKVNRSLKLSAGSDGTKIPVVAEKSRKRGSRWGGLQAYWIGEGTSITESKPKFELIELNLQKVAARCRLNDEILKDQVLLSSFLDAALPEEIVFEVEDALFNGDGVAKPLGVTVCGAKVTVAKESGQLPNTVQFKNIAKMYSRCWARSILNADWNINQDILAELLTMGITVGTGGAPVYMPANGAADAPFGRLLGRPVYPVEYAATLGTEGDIGLYDWSQVVLIDKGGVEAAMSIHVEFNEDRTVLRFVYRVAAQPLWKDPLDPANGANTLSPFVTLATRA